MGDTVWIVRMGPRVILGVYANLWLAEEARDAMEDSVSDTLSIDEYIVWRA